MVEDPSLIHRKVEQRDIHNSLVMHNLGILNFRAMGSSRQGLGAALGTLTRHGSAAPDSAAGWAGGIRRSSEVVSLRRWGRRSRGFLPS